MVELETSQQVTLLPIVYDRFVGPPPKKRIFLFPICRGYSLISYIVCSSSGPWWIYYLCPSWLLRVLLTGCRERAGIWKRGYEIKRCQRSWEDQILKLPIETPGIK